MIDNRVVGRRISAMRQQNGLTQQQLAAMMNVSHQAVSKWESGQTLPDIQTLLELTRFFGITVEQLIAQQEESAPIEQAPDEYETTEPIDTKQENANETQTQKEAEPMSIQQLLQMAPYMSKETVEEIVMEMEEPLTAGQIARIAPYVRPECVEGLIEKHHPELSWDHLRRIAPFMRREAVDILARNIASGKENIKQGSDNINKAINDIGKAFDDIGRGMGHAVKKAIRFGENVFNEVSAAINDISSDVQPRQDAPERSERARALRKKAMERAVADGNWDWIAAHIRETEGDAQLRGRIAAAAREQGMQDWVCRHLGEYADATDIETAIQTGNWNWLGENAARFEASQQERIARAAADAANWPWLEQHSSSLSMVNSGLDIARAALNAGETRLAVKLAEEHLAPEAVSQLADEVYAMDQLDALDELIQFANDAVHERILLDLANKQKWDQVERYIQPAAEETVEKLMEAAVEQGNFDAVDMLDLYL